MWMEKCDSAVSRDVRCVCVQKLVVENMEVLTQMRTSFDKPDHMAALFKKLTCKDTHTHSDMAA